MSGIKEYAHAKINLSLNVLERRQDGYHEVEMVMQSLELADLVVLNRSEKGINLSTNGADIPVGPGNLAWKAAKMMIDHFDLQGGVDIRLEKAIPVEAGLAGGSADAAAVIRGINKLWNLGQSQEQLGKLGAQIGSDVPFCILEGTALARGRGELVNNIAPCPRTWIVLVKPSIGVSTAEVYKRFSLEKVNSKPKTSRLIAAIEDQDINGVADLLCNVLESVTLDLIPEIALIKQRMIRAGAVNSLMSGSGSTVFGLAMNQAAAQAIADEFCQDGYTVIVTQTYNG